MVENLRRSKPSDPGLRVPPHSQEAEISVLGSILIDNRALNRALEWIKPDDFYRGGHRLLFGAMVDLADRGEPIDVVTLSEIVQSRGQIEAAGGPAAVAALVDSVPTSANIENYAKIVREKAILRRLIEAGNDIVASGLEGSDDVDQIVDAAQRRIFEVAERRIKGTLTSTRELVRSSFRIINDLQERKSLITGVPSSFTDLDRLTGGFQKSDLVILAARPSMGKTSLALNIAQRAAIDHGQVVAVFSLEMSAMQIVMRMLCTEARVDATRVRSGFLTREDWGRLPTAAGKISEAPLYIDDTASLSVTELKAKSRRLKVDRGLDLVIVDYLQLMQGRRDAERRDLEISDISRSLKALAKELDVPVVALSQLRRAVEDRPGKKRPQLSDLRECVTGETLVMLSNGRRVPIRDLVGTRPEVLSLSSDKKIVPAISDKVWSVGRRPVFDVLLSSGRSIRATALHRLFGPRGWVRVQDLAPGDRLGVARNIPELSNNDCWPDARVALLGHLIGDGSYVRHQPLRYTTASEENSRLVAESARAEFGVRINRHAGRGAWHQLVMSGNGNRWHPAGLGLWLRELGIFGQRGHEKRIPLAAFQLGKDQIALLLRHLWATDGCIWIRPRTARGSSRVFFATSSPGLASDVAALLLRLGIVGRIRTLHQERYRPLHTVDISGADQQLLFLNRVGAYGPRLKAAEKLSAVLEDCRPNPNVDTLPIEAFQDVKAVMKVRGVSQRAMASLRGTSYGGAGHFGFAPSRAVMADYASLLDDDRLRAWSTDELFWDRVVETLPAGEEEVFDLTVPGPASWLADGIVSHNSGAIEQDADVVIFIHREEMYRRGGEDDPKAREGIAEVIVGKQRNGPTGEIELAFLKQYATFENLARGYEE
jgi:replicative DNA helicase